MELADKFKLDCWRRCTDLLVDKSYHVSTGSLLDRKGEWHKDNPNEITIPSISHYEIGKCFEVKGKTHSKFIFA